MAIWDKAKNVINDAINKGKAVLEDAKRKAVNLVNDAYSTQKRLLKVTQKEIEKLLENARDTAQSIINEGYEIQKETIAKGQAEVEKRLIQVERDIAEMKARAWAEIKETKSKALSSLYDMAISYFKTRNLFFKIIAFFMEKFKDKILKGV